MGVYLKDINNNPFLLKPLSRECVSGSGTILEFNDIL